jgi:hypothetical protein
MILGSVGWPPWPRVALRDEREPWEKNPMRAARTGRWVHAPSWRLAIGSDARESRAARAPLSLVCCRLGWCWIGSRRNEGKIVLRPVSVLRQPRSIAA